MAEALARLVLLRRPRSILEFGAGASSPVLASAMAEVTVQGGRLTSLEHMPEHSIESWRATESVDQVDARLVQSPLRISLRPRGPVYQYRDARAALEERAPFDFVFIDGPPFFYGRAGTFPMVHDLLVEGATIVLDDVRRRAERRAIERWRRSFPGLEVEVLDPEFGGDEGYGIAILRYERNGRPRNPARNVLENAAEWIWNWRHIRWKLRSLFG